MKNRFFFVINIKDKLLGTMLDGIRLFADSDQKHNAHITIRGPYETKRNSLKDYSIKTWNDKISGEQVKVSGVSSFFNENQNTVFFECKDSHFLKDIWRKVSFKDFKPHITIYDGNNREYASRLLSLISSYNINFSFKVTQLSVLETSRFHLWEWYLIKNSIDYNALSKILNRKLDADTIESLDDSERFSLLHILCDKLESFTENDLPEETTDVDSDVLVEY